MAAQLLRRQRRRHRRPLRRVLQARLHKEPGGGRHLVLAALPLAQRRLRLRRGGLPQHQPRVRRPGHTQKGARGGSRAGDARVHGPGGEPHQRRAPLVRGQPGPGQPLPQILLLAAGEKVPLRRHAAAQQLGQPLRGRGLGIRPAERGVLPAHLRQKAARPEPRQPRRPAGGQGHHAFLAGHGRGRLPRGRDNLYLQNARPAQREGEAARRHGHGVL